ncbi:hypothetical protein GINT2_001561 [Glugoides intestinalis]
MDLLKKAYTNIDSCAIDGNSILVLGKRYDAEQIVTFPTKKTKAYSLKDAVFFLLNSEKKSMEYMSLCKQSGVTPISHVDKANILSDIQSFETEEVKGFFVEPQYVRTCEKNIKYEIPTTRPKNIILVSNSLIAKIHIDNIEKLLLEGVLDETMVDPFSRDRKEIKVAGNIFTVIRNAESLKEQDWKLVKAAFLENIETEESRNILKNSPKDSAIFTIKDVKLKAIKLEFSGGILQNLPTVLNHFKK